MHTIRDFIYNGCKIIIVFDINDLYAVTIHSSDQESEIMNCYYGVQSEHEAESVGKAFVDGLEYAEEEYMPTI